MQTEQVLGSRVGQPEASIRTAWAFLAMAVAALALAWAMTPRHRLAGDRAAVPIESLLPKQFGRWHTDDNAALLVSPQVEKELETIYSQTVSRTYVRDDGYRIMLSIAYGGDQTRDLQVHRPEACYVAQGFQLLGLRKATLGTVGRSIPVMHMESRLGARIEPVIYWVRIGDKLVRGNLEQGFARLGYGLRGDIADGLLFRVSSIDGDTARAFDSQEAFVRDLFGAVPPASARVFLGEIAQS